MACRQACGNCAETGCLRQQLGVPSGQRHEICRGLHAEQNAIIQAARYGVDITGASIYITTQPCVVCAKMLINAGITEIVYQNPLSRRACHVPARRVRHCAARIPAGACEDGRGARSGGISPLLYRAKATTARHFACFHRFRFFRFLPFFDAFYARIMHCFGSAESAFRARAPISLEMACF